jgi:hypothetical protein
MGTGHAVSPASSPRLGRRYQLDSRIGVGGHGEVWRGSDMVLGRPVAIKLLHAGIAHHPETLARFRAEARHAGALSHEGIAHVYDYCEPDPPDPPFLVMELVDGPSLAGVLADGPMDPARAMDIVAQVAAGLHAAHRAGLVHRDIKPGNVLLSRSGAVKIADFGLAHAAGSAPITSTGILVGTPGYLAPERVGGARATLASDLYSLGVVAYECLTGAAPFDGIPMEVALAHRDRPLPPLPAAVPAEVAALVMELTAKDPAARPGNAGDVARRAARLRDSIAPGPGAWTQERPDGPAAIADGPPGGLPGSPGSPPGEPHYSADERPDGQPAAAGERPTLRLTPVRRWRPAGRVGTGGVLAAAAVLAALLALTSVLGSGAPDRAAARPSGSPGPASPVARSVEVNASTLFGQPVSAAVRQLHELGLTVRVLWRPSDRQRAGTVLSVRPHGQVAAGSLVVLTGVLKPEHGKPPGNGGGHGGDHGNGHGHDGGGEG